MRNSPLPPLLESYISATVAVPVRLSSNQAVGPFPQLAYQAQLSVQGLILGARQISASDSSIKLVPDNPEVGDYLSLEKALLNQGDTVAILVTLAEEEGVSTLDTIAVRGRLIDGTIKFHKEKPNTTTKAPQARLWGEEYLTPFWQMAGIIGKDFPMKKWTVIRDTMLIMVLLLIALAMLLDAIIPF